jgi:hypothetical protein
MKKLLFAIGILLLTGCQNASTPATGTTPDLSNGIPNPASVNCTQKGGTLEMRTNEAGQYGVCKFSDGTECDEWEFLQGECVPGLVKSKPATPPTPATDNTKPDASAGIANPASVNCVQKGGKLDIRESDKGQYGVCVFTDGSECEEWAFMRGECKPGDTKNAGVATSDKPATPATSDGQPATCPTEKNSVCALVQVQCIKAPCPPLFETIDNECLAKKIGNMLLGYTPGTCEKTLNTTCKTDADCELPGEYAAMNRCPMAAKCIADSCVVVCPWPAK